jgi:hypothetical protein
MWFGRRKVTDGVYACLPPGNAKEEVGFFRAKKGKSIPVEKIKNADRLRKENLFPIFPELFLLGILIKKIKIDQRFFRNGF